MSAEGLQAATPNAAAADAAVPGGSDAPPSRQKRERHWKWQRRLTGAGLTLLGVAAILAVWQGLVWALEMPRFILPGPLSVAVTLVEARAQLAHHAWVTLVEIALGFGFGVSLGVATALWLMLSATARRVLHPVMVFSQAVPVFALAPILTLWFGFGLAPKIVMATLIIYFPVTSNFYDGLRRTDPGLLDLARTMGATRLRTLWHLRIPSALPSLGSGLRLAAVYAPIGAVIAEWVGASEGLGYLMTYANQRAKIDLMFAALLVLATMTVALHALASLAARRMARWAPESVGA